MGEMRQKTLADFKGINEIVFKKYSRFIKAFVIKEVDIEIYVMPQKNITAHKAAETRQNIFCAVAFCKLIIGYACKCRNKGRQGSSYVDCFGKGGNGNTVFHSYSRNFYYVVIKGAEACCFNINTDKASGKFR